MSFTEHLHFHLVFFQDAYTLATVTLATIDDPHFLPDSLSLNVEGSGPVCFDLQPECIFNKAFSLAEYKIEAQNEES